MKAVRLKEMRRKRRRMSTRNRLRHDQMLPRLSVHRTTKHISAQIIDEAAGRSLGGATTTAKRIASDLSGKSKTDQASFIGSEIARIAKEKGVEKVVFDRGHCKYHGRVKALAEAAREGGLKF